MLLLPVANEKMLDLVVKVDGGNPYSMILAVALVVIFAIVVMALVAGRRGK